MTPVSVKKYNYQNLRNGANFLLIFWITKLMEYLTNLFKNNPDHRVDQKKPIKPNPYTKKYKQLTNAKNGAGHSLP